MIRVLFLSFFISLVGCTTNQLHFSSFSTDNELKKIQNTDIQVNVIGVSGASKCGVCTESSDVVWHAANVSGSLYQGFFAIPVTDWTNFIKTALGSNETNSENVHVKIDRIFLKTWHDPQYYATQVELTVIKDGKNYEGKSVVKIEGAGQNLLTPTSVTLNKEAIDSVSLAIKSAYINALKLE